MKTAFMFPSFYAIVRRCARHIGVAPHVIAEIGALRHDFSPVAQADLNPGSFEWPSHGDPYRPIDPSLHSLDKQDATVRACKRPIFFARPVAPPAI
jgi:hypothetical protein